ncbi:MAG: PRTRC system protein C [Thermus sp.]
MERVLLFKGKSLPDPGPEWSPEQVKMLYSGQFPELLNAAVSEREEEGKKIVEFVPQVGTKG